MKVLAVTLASSAVLSSAIMATKREDPCECLNWKQVYKRNGAKCGDGHEFSFALRTGMLPWLAKLMYSVEFCYNFFMRIDDNPCVNMVFDNAPGEWWNSQWCYVAKECAIATPLNSSNILAAKICEPGKDKLMRDSTPWQLREMAREHDLSIGAVMKFAYPIETQAKWPTVEALFRNTSEVALAQVNASAAARLRYLQSTGAGFVLDSEKGRAPFGVIKGGKTYLVTKDEVNRHENHPWTHTNFECLHDCE